jgi:hypothetical protein
VPNDHANLKTTEADPWVVEMVTKIGTLPDDQIMQTSRIISAFLKTAIRHRPKSAAMRDAILRDAIGVAAVAAGEAL